MKPKPVKIDTEEDDEETYALGTAKIHIRPDPDPLNPRTEWDNLWTMYSNSKSNNFDYSGGRALTIEDIFTDDREKGETVCEAILRQNPDLLDARPVDLYDHSGQSVSLGSFGDPWDSGMGAVAVISREKAEEAWPELKGNDEALKEKAHDVLEGEVETLDQYLHGDVYAFTAEDGLGDDVDSCGGFFSVEDAVSDAAAAISARDGTVRAMGGLDIINAMNARNRTHFDGISWNGKSRDGEKLYTDSVSLTADYVETYGNPEILACQLGYQRGEFDGNSLVVWNDTWDDPVDTGNGVG